MHFKWSFILKTWLTLFALFPFSFPEISPSPCVILLRSISNLNTPFACIAFSTQQLLLSQKEKMLGVIVSLKPNLEEFAAEIWYWNWKLLKGIWCKLVWRYYNNVLDKHYQKIQRAELEMELSIFCRSQQGRKQDRLAICRREWSDVYSSKKRKGEKGKRVKFQMEDKGIELKRK